MLLCLKGRRDFLYALDRREKRGYNTIHRSVNIMGKGETCVRLETERLILREMVPEDFEALCRVLTDSDIMRHYPYAFDEARVKNWIACNRERYETLGFSL